MFKASDLAYWKPSFFYNILLILGIGYDLRFDCLFRFIKSLRKHTRFDLVLGCAKDGDLHSESFALSSTTIRTKCSFFKTYFTLVTGYYCEHIRFSSSLNFESTGSVFQVPIFPSNNSSIFCDSLSNPLHCFSVKSWNLFFVTFFLSIFSYLASKILCNILV